MTTPHFDPNLLAYLQAWRQYLEQLAGAAAAPGLTVPGLAFPGLPQPPVNPLMPPAMPPLPPAAAPPPAGPSPDYIQQLLNTLQAWRHYLETSTRTATATRAPAAAAPPGPPATPATKVVVAAPYLDDVGRSAPDPSPADVLPRLRPGSAYPPETALQGEGGDVGPTPKSLYSSAAQPAPSPTTEWWQAGPSPAPAMPSTKASASKAEHQPPAEEDQTQQTGPSEDKGDGSSTGLKPPDNPQHVAPLRQDLSLHPRLELIQPSRDLAR
ncbi:hypothetical protein V4U86_22520 [Mycobacterium sp. AMU20-3851]